MSRDVKLSMPNADADTALAQAFGVMVQVVFSVGDAWCLGHDGLNAYFDALTVL